MITFSQKSAMYFPEKSCLEFLQKISDFVGYRPPIVTFTKCQQFVCFFTLHSFRKLSHINTNWKMSTAHVLLYVALMPTLKDFHTWHIYQQFMCWIMLHSIQKHIPHRPHLSNVNYSCSCSCDCRMSIVIHAPKIIRRNSPCLMSLSDGYPCVQYWGGAHQQGEVDRNCWYIW